MVLTMMKGSSCIHDAMATIVCVAGAFAMCSPLACAALHCPRQQNRQLRRLLGRDRQNCPLYEQNNNLARASPFLEKITTLHVHHTLLVHFFAVTTAQLRRKMS